jgi:hypothetical protein
VKWTGQKKFEVRADGEGCFLWFAHPGGGRAEIRLDQEEMKGLRDEPDCLCKK